MRRVIEALALAVLLVGPGCRKPSAPALEPMSLRASLERDSVGLGDPVRLRLEASLPSGSRPILPGDGDSIGAWKVLRAGRALRKGEGAWDRWERDLTIAGYRIGWIGPDSLILRAVGARGESIRLACAPPRLRVGGQMKQGEPTEASRARDIRDVVSTGPARWPWIAAAAVLLIAGGIVLFRYIRARRRVLIPPGEPPGPTPAEEFEDAIARLLASGLLEQGLYREFYYEVSRAVRLYLERVHGLPLLESTSAEVMELLTPRLAGREQRDALRDWLSEGDLVKYARMERLQAEARHYLERSQKMVRYLARAGEPSASMPVEQGGGG